MTCLDAADVQHLVDETEQVAPPLEDLTQALALLRPRRVDLQELRESQYRIHGGAELMTHAGEKLALGQVRTLSVLLGLAQGFLRFLQLGDVLGNAQEILRAARLVQDRNLLGMEDSRRLVRGMDWLLWDIDQPSSVQDLAVPIREELRLRFREEIIVVLSDE